MHGRPWVKFRVTDIVSLFWLYSVCTTDINYINIGISPAVSHPVNMKGTDLAACISIRALWSPTVTSQAWFTCFYTLHKQRICCKWHVVVYFENLKFLDLHNNFYRSSVPFLRICRGIKRHNLYIWMHIIGSLTWLMNNEKHEFPSPLWPFKAKEISEVISTDIICTTDGNVSLVLSYYFGIML